MTEKEKEVDLYDDLKKELDKVEGEEIPEKPKEEVVPPKPEDKELEKKETDEKEISPEEEKEIIPESKTHEFKNVDEFLNAVQDPDSRNLLKEFHKVIKGENSAILAPIEAKNNEAKFESEFSKYEAVEGFSDHKDDLKKTFLRNPGQDIDALFAKTVTDLTLNRIKKVEKTPSAPNREGEVDLDSLSTDDLYNKLEGMRGK